MKVSDSHATVRAMGTPTSTHPHPIALVRTAHGWTVDELAARAAVHRATVIRLENRQHVPMLSTLQKIAEALDVPVQSLIEKEGVA